MWSNVLSSCNYQHSQDVELFCHGKGSSLCFSFILSLSTAPWNYERILSRRVEGPESCQLEQGCSLYNFRCPRRLWQSKWHVNDYCLFVSFLRSLFLERFDSQQDCEEGVDISHIFPVSTHVYPSPFSTFYPRWQSRRTCAQLLLKELQNYNLLLNDHQEKNVGSHQKKIPHVQGQRSPRKIVGRAKLHLESNPISIRDSLRAQTNLVCTRTQSIHRD